MTLDITVRFEVESIDNGSRVFKWPASTYTVTTTGENDLYQKQTVGAGTTEAMTVGDVAMGGLLIARNTHNSQTIDAQDAAGNHFASLGPGQPMMLPTSALLTLTWDNASGSDIHIEYWLIDP